MGEGGTALLRLILPACVLPAQNTDQTLTPSSHSKTNNTEFSQHRFQKFIYTGPPTLPLRFNAHQSNTVSLILSHMDGNCKTSGTNGKRQRTNTFIKFRNKSFPIQPITLTCRLSCWFHSGFAFFSMICVQS